MRQVDVIVQIAGEDILAGRAFFSVRRNAVSTTFAYDDRYWQHPHAYPPGTTTGTSQHGKQPHLTSQIVVVSVPPRRRLLIIDGRTVLCVQRFDRRNNQLLGYMSAMTLLQARDGDRYDYIDIADALGTQSGEPTRDLSELWRRMALSVGINNTDDHLRNHGLLREHHSWRLAPVFDINPNPDPDKERATRIDGAAPDDEPEALINVAELFRLRPRDARARLGDILRATKQWHVIAQEHGATAREIDDFADVFEQQQSRISAQLRQS